jgi:hypothetical protein
MILKGPVLLTMPRGSVRLSEGSAALLTRASGKLCALLDILGELLTILRRLDLLMTVKGMIGSG